MKKQTALLSGALLAACFLTACGGKSGSVSVDINKLSSDLKATVTSGELAEISPEIFASTYFLDADKISESAAFLGSGATACEVAVVKCSDSDYTDDVKDVFKSRVSSQSALYADYNAPEVDKLKKAIIESSGDYVVLCVTDDVDAAKKILKETGF